MAATATRISEKQVRLSVARAVLARQLGALCFHLGGARALADRWEEYAAAIERTAEEFGVNPDELLR
jgi:hypothetical protein